MRPAAGQAASARPPEVKLRALDADHPLMLSGRSLKALFVDVAPARAASLTRDLEHAGWTIASREASGADGLADALLEHETLDQDAAYGAAGLEPPLRPAPAAVAA